MTWVFTAKNQVHESRQATAMNHSQAVVSLRSHEAGAEHRAAYKVVPVVKVRGSRNTVFEKQQNSHFLESYLARCMDMSPYFYFVLLMYMSFSELKGRIYLGY